MNRTRLVVTFVISFLIAGAAGLLVLKKLKQTARASATSTVVVATRDLEIGTRLVATDLKKMEWSAGSIPQGASTDPANAVDRAVLYPMFRDEIVLEAKLAPVGSGAGMPAVIPEGMRAVSIRVDDVVAVAGFVGPGTKVDVLLTGNPGASGGGVAESLTKTILENVQVLAAGQKIQPDAQGRAEKVNVVTLLCTPEDAAKVTLAGSEGRIQLVLRNPMDKQLADSARKMALVHRRALYMDGAAKPPAPPPVRRSPPRPVVVAAPPPPPTPPPPAPTTASIEMLRGERMSKVEILLPPAAPSGEPRQ